MLATIEFSESGIAIIGALLLALSGAIVAIFKLLMLAKDSQVTDMKEQRDAFKKGYERSIELLEVEAQKQELARGGIPIPKLAPVKPEHNSPTTEKQQMSADLSTLKAREVAAKLMLQGGKEPDLVEMRNTALDNVVDGIMGRLSDVEQEEAIDRDSVEVAIREELARRLTVSQPTIQTAIEGESVIPDNTSPTK